MHPQGKSLSTVSPVDSDVACTGCGGAASATGCVGSAARADDEPPATGDAMAGAQPVA